uniref:DNA recombination protein RmuC n=1 Tax=uncultured bacterium contig00109 TaxID=1181574 RepID=A0A806KNY3_9BACT|nr:DNA recombination protein RmuC [uncultured bacterium contig00109]
MTALPLTVIILILAAVAAQIIAIVVVVRLRRGPDARDKVFQKISDYEDRLDKNEFSVREEIGKNREDMIRAARDSRDELTRVFLDFSAMLDKKIQTIQEMIHNSARANREELSVSLKSFGEQFAANVKSFNDMQREKFGELIADNNAKLEKMRETVDEKLHKTLETRLGESFKLVSERLEMVQKGLGEMQGLASGVGDLKRVLSNVKTKGVLGEYQLGGLLEQILPPAQYARNVKTRAGSADNVEFAVKIPSKDNSAKTIWLPVDAKFPTEDYEKLNAAYDSGNTDEIEYYKKELEKKIKLFAKDIKTKYVDPPNTTDFAIMFLPFEGLYAEVLRIPGLLETIQRDFKISITGPTTLAAFLNTLQMGFRSLAVEKRTSEIWELLGAVRAEFGKFGEVLEKTKVKLDQASKEIDNAGTRSRAIERKLRDVQTLPETQAQKLLGDMTTVDDE